MKIIWSAVSHEGERQFNEDAYYADSDQKIYVVADGMGGVGLGNEAAKRSCFYVAEFLESMTQNKEATWAFERKEELTSFENIMRISLMLTNERIFQEGIEEFGKELMGSTLIGCFIQKNKIVFGGVGNSRAYFFRDGYLQQLNHNDTYAHDKRIVPARSEINIPLTVLGLREKIETVFTSERSLRENDQIVFLTDGVTAALKNDELQKILSHKTTDLHESCEKIIDQAYSKNSSDNATILILEVIEDGNSSHDFEE